MNHISRLQIPQSLVDSVPSPQKRDLRYRVAWHQYHMIHATTPPRQSLTMPPTAPGTASTPIWYMSLRRKAIQQHPTDDTLRTQVSYKNDGTNTHGDQKGPVDTQQPRHTNSYQAPSPLILPMRSCHSSPTFPLWKATKCGSESSP